MQSQNNIKLFLLRLLCISIISIFPNHAFSEAINFKAWLNTESQNSLANRIALNSYPNNSAGLKIIKESKFFSSNIVFNYNNRNISFDNSFIEFHNNNNTIGFGKLERNWSFSPNTSLILSKNARPSDSLYFSFKNKKLNGLIPSQFGQWSFEAFNSKLSNENTVEGAMLLGMRAVIQPIEDLKFELVKTSQWGGGNYPENFSAFTAATLGNTNDGANSNINQLAGFGLSYSNKLFNSPLRVYAQFIGEDEANNLPSCYIHMVGSEMEISKSKIFQNIGIELIDTRIDKTTNGFCGPNTAYNNYRYNYTNYDKSLGAPIDSEGTSLAIWVTTQLYNMIDVKYSIQHLNINRDNWSDHRLSSSIESGLIASIQTSWNFKSLNINNQITYQNLYLDKYESNKGLSISLNTTYEF